MIRGAPFILLAAFLLLPALHPAAEEFPLGFFDGPHDVAPSPDGTVMGRLDPATARITYVSLGSWSRPHGVIVGPDRNVWVTDSGNVDLNTAAFDARGVLWFTGQAGVIGSVDPSTGMVRVVKAPRGRGPYGITSSPDGYVYYASLAGDYVGRIDPETTEVTVYDPPAKGQGTRRVWADSLGILWITGWDSGNLLRLDPSSGRWKMFRVPSAGANVRQILGRHGELWAAESGANKLFVIRY
jgi:virginiamycin B lyase